MTKKGALEQIIFLSRINNLLKTYRDLVQIYAINEKRKKCLNFFMFVCLLFNQYSKLLDGCSVSSWRQGYRSIQRHVVHLEGRCSCFITVWMRPCVCIAGNVLFQGLLWARGLAGLAIYRQLHSNTRPRKILIIISVETSTRQSNHKLYWWSDKR